MGRTDRILSWLLLTIGCACTLAWVAAALLDVRPWTGPHRRRCLSPVLPVVGRRIFAASSGVHYLFGPLFGALGHDVSDLRLFRLVSVRGRARWSWPTLQDDGWGCDSRSTPDRLSNFALGSLVVASGGITYGWLPCHPATTTSACSDPSSWGRCCSTASLQRGAVGRFPTRGNRRGPAARGHDRWPGGPPPWSRWLHWARSRLLHSGRFELEGSSALQLWPWSAQRCP